MIDRRGSKSLLDESKRDEIESLIQDNRYRGYDIKLDGLRHECDIPDSISDYTIIRALKARDIGFYIAATKEEIEEVLALWRVEFAREKLSDLFNTKLFKIRFSDKLHIGYGHEENRHYILRKRGRRYRYSKDCIRQKEARSKIDKHKKDNNDPDRKDEEGKIVYL